MIVLYLFLLLLLGGAQLWLKRRVASLEKKYVRVAKEADALVRQPAYRDTNGNRADPYQAAKRQYQLLLLAQKRDRVEARYTAAQTCRERFDKLAARVRGWKGKALPYALGALDVGLGLVGLDYLSGARYVNTREIAQAVAKLWLSH
jgi:hypothetical protein